MSRPEVNKPKTASENLCRGAQNPADYLDKQKEFFSTGRTISVSFRKAMLRRLYQEIRKSHRELTDALHLDLGKPEPEGYMCEVGLVLGEISYLIRHLEKWASPQRKMTELVNSFGKSFIIAEPLGNVLIMAPWNYPVLLSLEPLAGAIAAGNTVILKPSAYAPNTSHAMAKLLQRIFPPQFVAVVEGGRQENAGLLDLHFDHIFFTGSVHVGKTVMAQAAKNLTPVTLELGGKSPVVVDRTANVPLAAKRIVFGKLLNCGQTCIAPDYVLVEEAVHDVLVEALKKEFGRQCPDPLNGQTFAHLINQKHFERVLGLMDSDKIVYGGRFDRAGLRIEPTILDGVTMEDPVMQEEIFGPLLPVISVKNINEAGKLICSREKPLALYLFTNDPATEKDFLRRIPFGGGCINDTISHILSPRLPFGGTGHSGMGRYHGLSSFKTFSNEKSVVKKYQHPDLPMRYTPYKKVYEKMIRLIQR